MTDGECLTYLEDIQTTVIFTHIRTKEESWNFKTWFTREIVVFKDVRPCSLVVATDVLHKGAFSIFRAEGASTFLETKYSTHVYLNNESHGVITSHKIITFIFLFHRILNEHGRKHT
jgi:hypothetical protein